MWVSSFKIDNAKTERHTSFNVNNWCILKRHWHPFNYSHIFHYIMSADIVWLPHIGLLRYWLFTRLKSSSLKQLFSSFKCINLKLLYNESYWIVILLRYTCFTFMNTVQVTFGIVVIMWPTRYSDSNINWTVFSNAIGLTGVTVWIHDVIYSTSGQLPLYGEAQRCRINTLQCVTNNSTKLFLFCCLSTWCGMWYLFCLRYLMFTVYCDI